MSLADSLANALLDPGSGLRPAPGIWKQRRVNVGRGILATASHDDLVILLVPLEQRARTDAELPANFRGNRNLPLGSKFGSGNARGRTLPR
jgi:hypothetical protein